MSRPWIGDTAMTGTERQARYRAARMTAGCSHPSTGRPAKQVPAPECTIATLVNLQDLSELQAIDPTRGFGRGLNNEMA